MRGAFFWGKSLRINIERGPEKSRTANTYNAYCNTQNNHYIFLWGTSIIELSQETSEHWSLVCKSMILSIIKVQEKYKGKCNKQFI